MTATATETAISLGIYLGCFLAARVLVKRFQRFLISSANKSESLIDDTLIPFIGRILNMILWTAYVLASLAAIGLDIRGLLAGLGLLGLGISMAAKDFLSDMLATFQICLGQTILVGHEVTINQKLRGRVASIGMARTKLELENGEMVTIPNGKVVNAEIIIHN